MSVSLTGPRPSENRVRKACFGCRLIRKKGVVKEGYDSTGEPREKAGSWKFTRWDLVDPLQFKVKLKAEFQGSNRDMYRPEAIVASSGEEKD